MSSNTGSTTHSNLLFPVPIFDWLFMIDWSLVVDVVERIWVELVDGGDEFGVIIWILFCFRLKLLLDDLSVCLFHRFRFCDCSMCFSKQSICCWFVAESIFFHWKKKVIPKFRISLQAHKVINENFHSFFYESNVYFCALQFFNNDFEWVVAKILRSN